MTRSILWKAGAAGLALALGLGGAPLLAQHGAAASTPGGVVQVNTGRGRLVTLSRPMSDLFVADDSVADVQVRSPTQLYIFGKKPGETTISATARGGGVVYASTVRVGNNFDSIGAMLALAMPEAKIVATPMNGLVLLTGTVPAPGDAAEAERLVQAYVGDATKVLSRLRSAMPLQVNLQVRIAEVNRNFVKNIGNNITSRSNNDSGFKFSIGSGRQGEITTVPGTPTNTGPVDSAGARPGATLFKLPTNGTAGSTLNFFGHLLGLDVISALDLGETVGQVTTLANPNLTAISGETGTFLAGGEIPIPIAQGLGTVSVEFKQYGVSLSYTPIVLADGRISLRVRPEVSQLDYSNAVTLNGTRVPGITTRRTETTVELGSGQSMMISGLLSNIHNNSYDKTPGLGDVPILGALLRSNQFQRNESELVIVITPYLVKPVDTLNQIALPTDGYRAPTDVQRVLLGDLAESSKTPQRRPVPTNGPTATVAPTPPLLSPARPQASAAPTPGSPR
ncbi:type II and III secretion system protein family protein [Sphingomonas abaci]|uniref:Pilus assembly protein CpaC n=1 Tax=Sphingomonas abaci TaxID=237611 RepID=A0A7W7EYA7_9SPHN|nr:type II and III secretion system protein family protein [Sphingomonas abaci]MBB4616205.1 pilus assembly protein CpaC [Sphingomonas abaci]